MVCSAIGIAPVFAISLARRRKVDVLQITTYYSLAQCRPSSVFDGGEKSAYREERRGRGDHDGFSAYGMRQTTGGRSGWIHISRMNSGVCFLL